VEATTETTLLAKSAWRHSSALECCCTTSHISRMSFLKPHSPSSHQRLSQDCKLENLSVKEDHLLICRSGYQSVHAQLLTVPPWAIGFVCAIAISYSADRFNARGLHICLASMTGGIGWLTAGCLPHDAYVARYVCLCLAATGAFPVAPSMTNWVTCNTPSLLTIPFAIALNNSSAGLGQIIAQWIWLPGEKLQGYPTGNFTCAACSFYVAATAVGLRFWYGRMNKKGVLDARGEKREWSY